MINVRRRVYQRFSPQASVLLTAVPVVVVGMSELGKLEWLFFGLTAAVAVSVFLGVFGYFNPMRLFPRKSDLLLMVFAAVSGCVAADVATLYVFGSYPFSLINCVYVSVAAGCVVSIAHYLSVRLYAQKGRKKKIVLDVLPVEAARSIKEFAGLKLNDCVEFLSKSDLSASILAGKVHEIDLIIISKNSNQDFQKDKILLRAHVAGIPIIDYTTMINEITGRINLTHTDQWLYLLTARPQTLWMKMYFSIKSIFEPVIAALMLIALAPIFAAVAVAVKISSRGPILYRQVRTGFHDKDFVLIKFRSMADNAEQNGPVWASSNDQRVTEVGSFLRATRLDELPQLINIIKGEMSFVGPRPERPEIYQKLRKEIPLFSLRTVVRPGITGWAQVKAGYVSTVEDTKKKLEYDLFYIQNMSPRFDFVISLKTLGLFLPEQKSTRLSGAGGETGRTIRAVNS